MKRINLLTSIITFGICGMLTAQEVSTSVSGGVKASVSASQSAILNVSGQTVMDSAGVKVGKIEHVVVSPQGCLDVGLVSISRTKYVAVPWQLVAIQTVEEGRTILGRRETDITFRVNVDKAKLEAAPSFTSAQINTLVQQNNLTQVYTYFGVQQSGSAGATSSTGGTRDQSQSISGGAARSQSEQSLQGSATNQQSSAAGSQSGATNQLGGALSPTGRADQTNQYQNLPPGLQKRETLPPGLEKRESLPPGLEKRQSDTNNQGGTEGTNDQGIQQGQSSSTNSSSGSASPQQPQ